MFQFCEEIKTLRSKYPKSPSSLCDGSFILCLTSYYFTLPKIRDGI